MSNLVCLHLNDPPCGWRFQMRQRVECWRCALRNRRMLRRSLLTSAVVGTLLVAINQGPEIIEGAGTTALVWKIPLTYCVPFLVASWGALSNAWVRSD